MKKQYDFNENMETAGEALRRTGWLLVLPVLLLCCALALPAYLAAHRSANTHLHGYDPHADLGLVTVAAQRAEGSAQQGYEITLSAPVDRSYFSDALFVGDSITSGLQIYDMFAGFNVICKVGINTQSALTDEFYEAEDGAKLTMSQAVQRFNPRKLYVMLGTNGINWATTDWLLEGYRALVQQLKAENPDCMIILQSIPPVTEAKAQDNPSFLKSNFDAYNAGMKQLAIELGVYFLDVNAAFTTADGYLSLDYAAPDGVHFGYDGYQKWYDYLISHTVQGASVFRLSQEGYIVF